MNEIDNRSWIKEHREHCNNLRVSRNYFKENLDNVENLANKITSSNIRKIDMRSYLLKDLLLKIKNKIKDKNNVGLLCSGGEDSIFLLILFIKYLNIKPKLFCYESKNNKKDVLRLKKISKLHEVELNIFDITNLDIEGSYKLFLEKQLRPPNDIAQPVHNALYQEAVNKFNCDIVIDGQFCDTVLLSNPQNHFLLWYERYNFLLKNIIRIANLIPLKESKKIRQRIIFLNELINSSDTSAIILRLVNITKSDDFINDFTRNLQRKIGTQLTFSVYFFSLLLSLRERDKYLLCPKLYSPFDDFEYAAYSNHNLNQMIDLFTRKKPIRFLCKKHFPKMFRFQNTLPFELE
jgi:hypothetical protein